MMMLCLWICTIMRKSQSVSLSVMQNLLLFFSFISFSYRYLSLQPRTFFGEDCVQVAILNTLTPKVSKVFVNQCPFLPSRKSTG